MAHFRLIRSSKILPKFSFENVHPNCLGTVKNGRGQGDFFFPVLVCFEVTKIANFQKTMFCSLTILSLVLISNAWFNRYRVYVSNYRCNISAFRSEKYKLNQTKHHFRFQSFGLILNKKVARYKHSRAHLPFDII